MKPLKLEARKLMAGRRVIVNVEIHEGVLYKLGVLLCKVGFKIMGAKEVCFEEIPAKDRI